MIFKANNDGINMDWKFYYRLLKFKIPNQSSSDGNKLSYDENFGEKSS